MDYLKHNISNTGKALLYPIKPERKRNRITRLAIQAITYPYRVLVKEFGVSRFLAIFLLTFCAIAIIGYLASKYIL